jgi:hypothetical protein
MLSIREIDHLVLRVLNVNSMVAFYGEGSAAAFIESMRLSSWFSCGPAGA